MPILNRENGVSIYYQVQGNKKLSDKVCILIGGLTRDHTIWRRVAPLLEQDFQILLLDNRDVGQSGSYDKMYNISEMAEDVADLVDSLHLSKVNIIGHSLGGFVALHLAATNPDIINTLTLCSAADKQPETVIKYLTERVAFIEKNPDGQATTADKENIINVIKKLYSPKTLENKDFIEEIIAFETKNPYPQSAESFKRQANACINHDAEDLIKKITCPTLMVTGKDDNYYTPEVINNVKESKIPHAKIEIIPDASHMIQLEQPIRLAAAIKNFLIHS